MSKPKHVPGYTPNPHYTQEDWDEVSDNPKLTDEELAEMRPASEVLPPELYAALTKRRPGQRGPGKKPAKVQITMRLDRNVVEAFQATGHGWRTRMNDILAREAKRLPKIDAQ